MIASMTWQLTPHSVALPLLLFLPLPRLTATNISDIIYHQPACQSSHWVQKITAPSKRGARPLRTLMTRPHPATPPLCCSALSLGCAVKKLLCLLILPMRAALPHLPLPPCSLPPRVLPTLSSAALVVNYTTKNYVCLLPAASGRAPAPAPSLSCPLYACVA